MAKPEEYRIKNKYHLYIYNEFMEVKDIENQDQCLEAHNKAFTAAITDTGFYNIPIDLGEEIKEWIEALYLEAKNTEENFRASDNRARRTKYQR